MRSRGGAYGSFGGIKKVFSQGRREKKKKFWGEFLDLIELVRFRILAPV